MSAFEWESERNLNHFPHKGIGAEQNRVRFADLYMSYYMTHVSHINTFSLSHKFITSHKYNRFFGFLSHQAGNVGRLGGGERVCIQCAVNIPCCHRRSNFRISFHNVGHRMETMLYRFYMLIWKCLKVQQQKIGKFEQILIVSWLYESKSRNVNDLKLGDKRNIH